MKAHPSTRLHAALLIAAFAAIYCPAGRAITIDFNGIPNGTPVSAGNPYGGLVNIQGWAYAYPYDFGNPGLRVSLEATIQDGAIEVFPPPWVPGTAPGSESELVATFLQPVTDVTFKLAGYWFNGYSLTAVDGLGNSIITSGGVGHPQPSLSSYEHIVVPVPPGYWVTELKLGSRGLDTDPAFRLDDLSFELAPVPDSASSATLLALASLGLLAFARIRTGTARPR